MRKLRLNACQRLHRQQQTSYQPWTRSLFDPLSHSATLTWPWPLNLIKSSEEPLLGKNSWWLPEIFIKTLNLLAITFKSHDSDQKWYLKMESQHRSLGYRDAFAAGEECSTLTFMTVCVFPVPGSFAIMVCGEALTLILSFLRNPLCQV